MIVQLRWKPNNSNKISKFIWKTQDGRSDTIFHHITHHIKKTSGSNIWITCLLRVYHTSLSHTLSCKFWSNLKRFKGSNAKCKCDLSGRLKQLIAPRLNFGKYNIFFHFTFHNCHVENHGAPASIIFTSIT